jgi:hypothetical protein
MWADLGVAGTPPGAVFDRRPKALVNIGKILATWRLFRFILNTQWLANLRIREPKFLDD